MPITDIYSKRQKRLRGDLPDVYRYDHLPSELRVQMVHIFRDLLGSKIETPTYSAFKTVHDLLCREYGLFNLSEKHVGRHPEAVAEFVLSSPETEKVLDAVETTMQVALIWQRKYTLQRLGANILWDEGVEELNARFREHGAGFQFENGEIVRVDSQLAHQEIVRPTLQFLNNEEFAGPNQEFLSAHEHYRHNRFKEAIADAAKALESTLKVIARNKNWPVRDSDTAKALIDTAFQQGLMPPYIQSEFSAIRSTLESGVPVVRNKIAGHCQGATPTPVPRYLVSYVLHLTATAILLLVEAAKHEQP